MWRLLRISLFPAGLLALILLLENTAIPQGGPAGHMSVAYVLPKKCSPLSGDILGLITKGPNTFAPKKCATDNTWSDLGSGALGPSGATGASGPSGAAGPAFVNPGATFVNAGNTLTSGPVTYKAASSACTIVSYNIWADTGTVSFDVWKIATGTALPTVSNTIISGSSYLALSSGTNIDSTTLTSLTTTSVAAKDIFGFKLQAVTGSPTQAHIELRCQ